MKFIRIVKCFTIIILSFNLFIIFYGFNIFNNEKLIIEDKIGFKEKFNRDYFYNIRSIKALNLYFNKIAVKRKISKTDYRYIDLASETVKNRFYYNGYSYYDANENLILYILGKYFWDDFDAIVIPDDILKKEHAACSQQSIVLMELFKINGFPVRKISLNRHFALETKFNGKWYFFDPTFEPNFNLKRKSLNLLLQDKKILYSSYQHVMTKKQVDWRFSKIKIGKTNLFPATKMKIFHKMTKFYLRHLIFISFVLALMVFLLNKVKNKYV